MTPLEIFEAWYHSQPNDVRAHIAFAVGCCAPDLGGAKNLSKHLQQSEESFQEWLNGKPTSAFQELGRIFIAREAVSLLVFHNSTTADDWDLKVAERRELRKAAKKLGHHDLLTTLDQSIKAAPAQKKLWMESARSWQQLRNSSLSNEALEAWFKGEQDRAFEKPKS